jgi:protease I
MPRLHGFYRVGSYSQEIKDMAGSLKGKRIAIVATDGFEQSELLEPRKALEAEGATVDIIAPQRGEIQGMEHHDKGKKVAVDLTIDEVKFEDYAALVLPGGVANPDTLRINAKVVGFIRKFVDAKKPVAAICHGPWTLIEAKAVSGKTMTSWPSLKTDLENAGAHWVDRDVVREDNLVTSRKPDDLPAFCREVIEMIRAA